MSSPHQPREALAAHEVSAAAPEAIMSREVTRWRAGRRFTELDDLAVEEPCELRVGGHSVAVVMRTPGHDQDLARGFLITEGIVGALAEVTTIEAGDEPNVIEVRLVAGHHFDPERLRRNLYASSSCGLCGKASIKAVRVLAQPLRGKPLVSAAVLAGLDNVLQAGQEVFRRTGALHGAGLCNGDGRLLVVREDVGRHNAVDKVIGAALAAGTPDLAHCILVVSGRASFEVTQKALVAGIPTLAAVSAPSSLAVELAQAGGMLLAGFVRGGAMTVYSAPERVAYPAP